MVILTKFHHCWFPPSIVSFGKILSPRDGWGSFFTPTVHTHALLLSSFVIRAMSPRGSCLDSTTLVIALNIARHSLLKLQHSSRCAPLATVFAPYTWKPYDLCYRFIPYYKPENLSLVENIGFLLQAWDVTSLVLTPCYYFQVFLRNQKYGSFLFQNNHQNCAVK